HQALQERGALTGTTGHPRQMVNWVNVGTQILGCDILVRTFSQKIFGRRFGLISDWGPPIPLESVVSCFALLPCCLLASVPLILLGILVSDAPLPSSALVHQSHRFCHGDG